MLMFFHSLDNQISFNLHFFPNSIFYPHLISSRPNEIPAKFDFNRKWANSKFEMQPKYFCALSVSEKNLVDTKLKILLKNLSSLDKQTLVHEMGRVPGESG